MPFSRRDFVRIVGSSAGAALLWGGVSLGGCSSKNGPPRSEAEAKKAIARAVYGRELAVKGERLIERARLDEDQREDLAKLMKRARAGAELDRSVMSEHGDLVKRLLREVWGDEELLWHAVGYPHGPGVCTTFDLYTRPPAEAHMEKRRGRKRGA